MRRYLRPGLWIAVCSAAAAMTAAPIACAPDSSPPPTNGSPSSGAGGSSVASSGANSGAGGDLFEAGPGCQDPTDSDGDFVADVLELAPDTDTDSDGKVDKDDTDSDDDGALDSEEALNPLLEPGQFGQTRETSCDPVADSDFDKIPDLRDKDSDNDGMSDKEEAAYDPDGSLHCRVLVDCDKDGVIDIVELAAGSNPTDASSIPADAGLYFVLPYQGPEKTKDFVFSAGVAKADIYFLIDTTASMQPAIDGLKASISATIIPSILNGDLGAMPPIPPIADAWIGVGDFRDVPWGGYGQPGDDIYRNRFAIGPMNVSGTVAQPIKNGMTYSAPDNVTQILGSLTAAGGGDGPEATTQALWIASTGLPYAATVGGPWLPAMPYPAPCSEVGMFAVPCFRPGSLPLFVIVTDAAFHNGPSAANNYNPATVGGTKTYAEAIAALASIDAKVIGVPVAGGNPLAARADLNDLAKKTGSYYHDPAFGGSDKTLVAEEDVTSGEVSKEVVRLVGLLAGAGLKDATTAKSNYDCAGSVDCTGDGVADPEYHNPSFSPGEPFDASTLISKIETVASQVNPLPYGSLDAKTFFGVRGDAEVTFRVHAKNDTLKPPSLAVLRARIRVETPSGQILGGKAGTKLVYFVIPEFIPGAN